MNIILSLVRFVILHGMANQSVSSYVVKDVRILLLPSYGILDRNAEILLVYQKWLRHVISKRADHFVQFVVQTILQPFSIMVFHLNSKRL